MKELILKWMQEFVEQPNAKLGNWAPCPYARKARLDNQIEIVEGENVLVDYLDCDFDHKEVYVFWYPTKQYSAESLSNMIKHINSDERDHDIVLLEDHPDDVEIIAGVTMNFGPAILVIAQRLSKLNEASAQLSKKDYYDHWSKENLKDVKDWRYK